MYANPAAGREGRMQRSSCCLRTSHVPPSLRLSAPASGLSPSAPSRLPLAAARRVHKERAQWASCSTRALPHRPSFARSRARCRCSW